MNTTAKYQDQDNKLKEMKRKIQKKTRRSFWAHIESIITPMESEEEKYTCMKRFWSFTKHQKKDYKGEAQLKHLGQTHTDPKEKANIMNQQFESVLSKEVPIRPDLLPEQSVHPQMEDIQMTEPGVQKLLEQLKAKQGCRP